MTDAALMLAVQSGDSQAMTEIDNRYRRPLEFFMLGRRIDPVRADDFVQETLIRCWERASQYQDSGRLFGWLCTLATNVMLDEYRRTKRMVFMSNGKNEDEGSPMEMLAISESTDEQTDRREFVKNLLGCLSEIQRDCITGHYFQGQTTQEIADDLGVSIDVVKKNLVLARAKMKDQLVGTGMEAVAC